MAASWKAIVLKMAKITRSGNLALYDRCAHSLCAPAVIPKADATYSINAGSETNL